MNFVINISFHNSNVNEDVTSEIPVLLKFSYKSVVNCHALNYLMIYISLYCYRLNYVVLTGGAIGIETINNKITSFDYMNPCFPCILTTNLKGNR